MGLVRDIRAVMFLSGDVDRAGLRIGLSLTIRIVTSTSAASQINHLREVSLPVTLGLLSWHIVRIWHLSGQV